MRPDTCNVCGKRWTGPTAGVDKEGCRRKHLRVSLTRDEAFTVVDALYHYCDWADEATADDEAYADDREAASTLMDRIQKEIA